MPKYGSIYPEKKQHVLITASNNFCQPHIQKDLTSSQRLTLTMEADIKLWMIQKNVAGPIRSSIKYSSSIQRAQRIMFFQSTNPLKGFLFYVRISNTIVVDQIAMIFS